MNYENVGRGPKRVTIRKEFEFHSAHHLPNHLGKCKNLHGHTYKLFVTVGGFIIDEPECPAEGMIMDFGDLKKVVTDLIISKLDHLNLDEVLPFITTAENMAHWMLHLLLGAGVSVTKIELYETPTACAIAEVDYVSVSK